MTISRPRRKPHRKKTGARQAPDSGLRVSGRLWIEMDGRTFLSWGRVVLLERIKEHGSLRAAAASMGMGYRHAWLLVDEMNRVAPRPLVVKAAGGRHGGGSVVTPEGEAAVTRFRRLVAELSDWLDQKTRKDDGEFQP